jgi:serine phosphatase RsbU (regulator of sigma subunit)
MLTKPWLDRSPSLALVLSVGLGFAVLLMGIGCGAYALHFFRQEKMRDTLAIMFLELERTALGVGREARSLGQSVGLGRREGFGGLPAPDVVVRVGEDRDLEVLRGSLPKGSKLPELETGQSSPDDLTILQFGGVDYLGRIAGAGEAGERLGEPVAGRRFLVLWRTNVADWIGELAGRGTASRVYLLTRQGALLYTSTPDITAVNYLKRPLVQKFVQAPFRLGQVGFKDDAGADWYGFFYEVPGTNVIAFAEAPRSVALAPVRSAVLRFGLMMATGLILCLIILQVFLEVITEPIRRLMNLTRQVGAGVFDQDVDLAGCREIRELTASFRDMSGSLAARDARIQTLMAEQAGKIRLESEIELARTVQRKLLPHGGLKRESGLELGVLYLPATELAGDWYGYSMSDDGDETTLAIADISGHGAGSAMFMTLIAGAFEELRLAHGGSPPPRAFIEKTHSLIQAVGLGDWHATMLAVRFRRSTGELQVVNAGHTFPLLVRGMSDRPAVEVVKLPSMFVGGSALNLNELRLTLAAGEAFAMYSDGLLEAQNAGGRRFGIKSVRNVCLQRSRGAGDLVDRMGKQWKAHLKEAAPTDDCCFLVARAV